MNNMYYDVTIRGSRGGQSTFTYHSEAALQRGQLVVAPLQNRPVLGVVSAIISRKPAFKTRAIAESSKYVLPLKLLDLITWMNEFYACNPGASLQLILPPKVPKNPKPRKETQLAVNRKNINHLPLTREQTNALVGLATKSKGTCILHGETGSGKTRVYAELVTQSLSKGLSALILVPEIGMTSQLAADIGQLTSQQVAVIHSELTPAQRQKLWIEIYESNEPKIIIGTRSALFAPIDKLGIIIVDESHDASYKQESSPRYSAIRVASQLGKIHACRVILGSATPSVSDYFLAKQKAAPIIRLHKQATGHEHDTTSLIIDKRERRLFTKSYLLSNPSIDAITQTLQSGLQCLLFLNRRGTAKLCLCHNCGWFATCSNCQLPLTYHRNKQALLCHSCGNQYPPVTACPECGSVELRYQTPGVQALESEVEKLFPTARITRIDSDGGESNSLTHNYQALYDGDIDIIIGTQTVAKGLDLPKLQLEVVVDADSGLHMPDYLAGERMFQLLYQVIGRIGRHQSGQLIVQTLTPDHPIIATAINRDYETFYTAEIAARKMLRYPPFTHLARIVFENTNEAGTFTQAHVVAEKIRQDLHGVTVLGPSVCFYPLLRSKHRVQLIVMTAERHKLTLLRTILPTSAFLDIDPAQLL